MQHRRAAEISTLFAQGKGRCGVLSFTHALAAELGCHGIAAKCVAPGLIDTGTHRVRPTKRHSASSRCCKRLRVADCRSTLSRPWRFQPRRRSIGRRSVSSLMSRRGALIERLPPAKWSSMRGRLGPLMRRANPPANRSPPRSSSDRGCGCYARRSRGR